MRFKRGKILHFIPAHFHQLTPQLPPNTTKLTEHSQNTHRIKHRILPKMPPITLEIPIFTPTLPASLPPSTRLELNAANSYPAGGLTPPLPLPTFPSPRPPLRIMIRPRGAPPSGPDFVYTASEIASMLEAVRGFKAVLDPAVDGFVFGVLAESAGGEGGRNGKGARVDVQANKRLVAEAAPFGCTFHRAFDDVLGTGSPVQNAVQNVLDCGFDGILTSGGPGNAIDNLGVLREVVAAVGGRMDVLVGGGVRASNAGRILGVVGGAERVWLHSSCLRGGEEVDGEELRALAEVMEKAA